MTVLRSIEVIKSADCKPSCFFIRTEEQSKEFFGFDQEIQSKFCISNSFLTRNNNAILFNSGYYNQWEKCELEEKESYLYFANNLFVVFYKRYCRAKFLGLDDNGLIKAYLIDYGDNILVDIDKCYGIARDFVDANAFALRCHLEMFRETDDLSDDALNFFTREIQNAENAIIKNDELHTIESPWQSLALDLSWKALVYEGIN